MLRIPIDPDLQPYFHGTKAVNDGLRTLVAEGRYPKIESEEILDPDAEIDFGDKR